MLDTTAGTVAILAFTDIIPGGFSGRSEPGASPDQAKVLAAIKAAKAKADYVIVSFHWGIEYTGNADQDQRRLAHQAIDAGADLVLGHHPHVIQGLELYHGKLIAYSMGDCVAAYRESVQRPLRLDALEGLGRHLESSQRVSLDATAYNRTYPLIPSPGASP